MSSWSLPDPTFNHLATIRHGNAIPVRRDPWAAAALAASLAPALFLVEVDAVAVVGLQRHIMVGRLARDRDAVLAGNDHDLIAAPHLALEHFLVAVVVQQVDVTGMVGGVGEPASALFREARVLRDRSAA